MTLRCFTGDLSLGTLHEHGFQMCAPGGLDTNGGIFVTADGSFSIPFRGRPLNPCIEFLDIDPNCGPIPSPDDVCTATAVNMGRAHRPRWFLVVAWHIVSPVRTINWFVDN